MGRLKQILNHIAVLSLKYNKAYLSNTIDNVCVLCFKYSLSCCMQGPSEKITILCNKHSDGDIDQILTKVDTEEFHGDLRKKDKAESKIHM